MRRAPAILLAAFCPASFADDSEPRQRIEIIADVPSVVVAPRRPGPFMMQLPNLTYSLSLTAECVDNWKPDSVSVNVADSRTSFRADALPPTGSLQFELLVPSKQIGPLRLERFCIVGIDEDLQSNDRITIPSVLSAQASLRCASDSASSIRYVTVPLDVSLECINAPPETEE